MKVNQICHRQLTRALPITNDEVLRKVDSGSLSEIVRQNRPRFAGHNLRLPENRPAYIGHELATWQR